MLVACQNAVEVGGGDGADRCAGQDVAQAIKAEPFRMGLVVAGVRFQLGAAHCAEIIDAADFELGVVAEDDRYLEFSLARACLGGFRLVFESSDDVETGAGLQSERLGFAKHKPVASFFVARKLAKRR